MATAKWCRKQQIYNMADKTPFVARDRALTMSRTRRKETVLSWKFTISEKMRKEIRESYKSNKVKQHVCRDRRTYRAARRNAEREARRKNRR